MTIYEFADIIGKNIEIMRHHNQDERWSAQFESCETKGDGVLIGEYGDGKTPTLALSAYVAKIRGKTIVFHSYSNQRQEFTVPKSIKPVIER